jgi:hypothetical protein
MRIVTILLGVMIVLVVGCRSSEKATGGAPATGDATADMDRPEKPAPHPDDADRYDRKAVGEYEREAARREAARERDRQIDEDPVEQPPETPPDEEKPPR